MADLKPCPFCGSDKIECADWDGEDGPYWAVSCLNAECDATQRGLDEAEAIRIWNRRAPQPEPTEADVEAVTRAICHASGCCKYLAGRCNTSRCATHPEVARAALRAFVAKRNGGGS